MVIGSVSAKFYMFGHPRLELPNGEIVPIQSRKGIALLALLAMSDRGERSRVWLQQMLWGSRPQQQAQSSLRRELANLRKTLNDFGLEILVSEHRVLRLDVGSLWLDIDHLEDRQSDHSDFLEGIDIAGEDDFEDWLRQVRSRTADMRDAGAAQAVSDARTPALESAIMTLAATDATGTAAGRLLAEQVTRDLFDLLPRLRWLPIIPAGTAAQSPGDPHGNLKLSERYGARYVLQTEIFDRVGEWGAQFTMVEMPGQIIRWSDRREFPAGGGDAVALRKEVARAVNCVSETFDQSEQRHAFDPDKADASLAPLVWKIRFHINQFTRPDFEEAGKLIDAALERHPAHGELLMLRANLAMWRSWIARADSVRSSQIEPLIRAAMRADPADARGPLYAGILDTWQRRGTKAEQSLIRACTLDPSSAQAFSHLGAAYYLGGNPLSALEPLEHALFLAPLDPKRFHTVGQLAVVLWMLGRYDEALVRVAEIQATHPGYVLAHIMEVACLTEMGRTEEADAARARIASAGLSKYEAVLDWMPFVDARWTDRLRSVLTSNFGSKGGVLKTLVGQR